MRPKTRRTGSQYGHPAKAAQRRRRRVFAITAQDHAGSVQHDPAFQSSAHRNLLPLVSASTFRAGVLSLGRNRHTKLRRLPARPNQPSRNVLLHTARMSNPVTESASRDAEPAPSSSTGSQRVLRRDEHTFGNFEAKTARVARTPLLSG